jgi:hypothetical protein
MTDVEDRRPLNSTIPNNPYANALGEEPIESIYLFRLRRVFYMAISIFGLQHFKFYGVILRSPHVRHEWFKVGLATSIGTQGML